VKLELGCYLLLVILELPMRRCSIAQPDPRQPAIAPQGRPRPAIVRKVLLHSPLVQPVMLQRVLARQAGWLDDRKTTPLSLDMIM